MQKKIKYHARVNVMPPPKTEKETSIPFTWNGKDSYETKHLELTPTSITPDGPLLQWTTFTISVWRQSNRLTAEKTTTMQWTNTKVFYYHHKMYSKNTHISHSSFHSSWGIPQHKHTTFIKQDGRRTKLSVIKYSHLRRSLSPTSTCMCPSVKQ